MRREERTHCEKHHHSADFELQVLPRSRLIQNPLGVVMVDRFPIFHHSAAETIQKRRRISLRFENRSEERRGN